MAQIIDKPPAKELVSGEKLPYLGRRYFLELVPKPAYQTQECDEEVNAGNDQDVKFSFYQGKFWLFIRTQNKDDFKKFEDQTSEEFEKARNHIVSGYKDRAM